MRTVLTACLMIALAACASPEQEPTTSPDDAELEAPALTAGAAIEPVGDSDVTGTVTFSSVDDGVEVTYSLSGLTPGLHGFHVHENGSCGDGEDGTPGGAAGGHYAPTGSPHGARSNAASARHTGDLGNIEVGDDGTASGTFVDAVIAIEGADAIVGRAMMIHGGEDDLTSQPSGAAGARVGCGVIELSESSM